MSNFDQPQRGYLPSMPPPHVSPPPPPVPPQRPRQPRTPWVIAGVSVVVAIGAVLFGLGVFKPLTAGHGAASRGTFDISGTITVQGGLYTDYLDEGANCTGTGGYSDMSPGTPVTVGDATGKIVATGALGKGQDVGDGCMISLDVPNVPDNLHEYVVTISHRGSKVYSWQEASQPIQLTLGN